MKKKVLFDMETNDFDDYLTLCLLAGTSQIDLVGVTITPGTPAQVGLVKQVLKEMDRGDVLVGASNIQNHGNKDVIAPIHYKVVDKIIEMEPDGYAEEIIHRLNMEHKDKFNILTGAGLSNIASYLKRYKDDVIENMFIQGGFAGSNIVAIEDQLKKFEGKESIRTFNFCCDIPSAMTVLNSNRVKTRHLVSKNVCHGTAYDSSLHDKITNVKKGISLQRIYDGMDMYLVRKKKKMLHDPLMALSFLNPNICNFEEIEMSEKSGEWKADVKKGTNTFISVKCNYNQFYSNLVNFI